MANAPRVSIGAFLDRLRWLDGTPLRVEPYRRRLFERFHERDDDGRVRYSLGLDGRAKKNNKTLDLVTNSAYALFDDSPHGSQVRIVANDEGQGDDDLDLLKKLIRANPALLSLVRIKRSAIERRDGAGFIVVEPAQDAIGAHGKTYRFLGVDEIHGYRNWDLLEALALDPTRPDAQMWITSYASVIHRPGAPLFDLMRQGKAGTDPRMLFSWYAADFTTDPEFQDRSPEERANPSMANWDNTHYLEEQRRRLPAHKYRRLHLNLPGVPEGSAFQPEPVMDSVARNVTSRLPVRGVEYAAFVDMSGGSADDAVLAIGHRDADDRAVLDRIVDQGQRPPFDPNRAVDRFVAVLREFGIKTVTGDRYAGETFRAQFEAKGIRYAVCEHSKSQLYEALEPSLNGRRVVLLDVPQLEQQLLGLVWRGGRIDHPAGEHDDFANAAAGAVAQLVSSAGCRFCDEEGCGGPDDPPLMMVTGAAYAEWWRVHHGDDDEGSHDREDMSEAGPSDAELSDAEEAALLPHVERLCHALEAGDGDDAREADGALDAFVEGQDEPSRSRMCAAVERVRRALQEELQEVTK